MTITSVPIKRRLSRIIQRAPWLAFTMRAVLYLTRIRYSAGVVGVVLDGQNRILLVEHVFHPKYPWGLPGGWMEKKGESPVEALRRELREETGIEVQVLCPLLVETGYYFRRHLDIAYLCTTNDDVQTLSVELMNYRWVSFDTLPPMLPFHQVAVTAARTWQASTDRERV